MRPILKEGSSGSAVRDLTGILVARGFFDSLTSVFDRHVRKAVKDFQARHVDERGRPLVVDGVVGPLTWWALDHEDNRPQLGGPIDDIFFRVPSTGGSRRGRAALRVAIDEMEAGARERGANNDGPFVRKYLDGIIPPPANWCAGFVSWCFDQHEEGSPFGYSLGAKNIRNRFRDRRWLYDAALEPPQPGDLVFWWRDRPDSWKGHIGFVHHFSHGILYTLEGNKGGFPAPVRPFDYVLSRMDQLLGFGRVPHDL